jgi:hypothetical protein
MLIFRFGIEGGGDVLLTCIDSISMGLRALNVYTNYYYSGGGETSLKGCFYALFFNEISYRINFCFF